MAFLPVCGREYWSDRTGRMLLHSSDPIVTQSDHYFKFLTFMFDNRTQGAASDAGRKVAKQNQSELVIHRPNGQIRDKDSYGNDSCPPKDKKH